MPGRNHFEGFRDPKKIEEGGVVKIAGAFLLDHQEEVINLIKHESELAFSRNKNAKIEKIKKVNGGFEVKLSDHNLALRIGKALVSAYKGEHKYKFLPGEKFVEVEWKRD